MIHAHTYNGRTVFHEGKEYLYFCGTSYLAFAYNKEFQALITEGMKRYGANFGSSRNTNVMPDIYKKGEEWLAEWLGTETVLTFSSGSFAGYVTVNEISKSYAKAYGPICHPALMYDNTPYFKESTWDNLFHNMKSFDSPLCILFDSIDPVNVNRAPVERLKELPSENDTLIVVDDSHGIGATGSHGHGIIEKLKKYTHHPVVLLASIGKAFDVPGGLIGGPSELLEDIRNTVAFGASSPVSPAYLYAFTKSRDLIIEARSRLQDNLRYFKKIAPSNIQYKMVDEYPFIFLDHDGVYEFLEKRGIYISDFSYPSKGTGSISRIILNAAHTKNDLEYLCESLAEL